MSSSAQARRNFLAPAGPCATARCRRHVSWSRARSLASRGERAVGVHKDAPGCRAAKARAKIRALADGAGTWWSENDAETTSQRGNAVVSKLPTTGVSIFPNRFSAMASIAAIAVDTDHPSARKALQAPSRQGSRSGAQIEQQPGGTVERHERVGRRVQDLVVVRNEREDLPVILLGPDPEMGGNAHAGMLAQEHVR